MSNCTAKCSRAIRVLNAPMFAFALALLCTAFGAHAAQKTWNGSGTNWNSATSWSPNGVPAAGDDLVFDGPSNLTSNNNIAAGTLFNSITFAPSAGAFTLSGNAFALNSSVTNNSNSSQTINSNVLLSNGSTASITFTNNTLAALTFGNVSGGSGGAAGVQTLTTAGAGPITINGAITVGGAAQLVLTDTSVSTLSLLGTGNAVTTLNINTPGGFGVVDIGANGLAINDITGNSAIQPTFAGNNNATGGGLLTILQNTATDGGNVGTQTGTLTINAQITGNNCLEAFASPTCGVLALTNVNNNFTGDLIINAGTVSVSSIGSAGSASPVGMGRIRFGNLASSKLSYTGPGETPTRVFDLLGGTTGGIIEQAGTGLLKISNLTVSTSGAKTLVLQGSTTGTGEFAGVIADSASGAISITKSGTGSWLLSAANTNTGTTTVANGTLTVGNGTTGSLNGAAGTPLTFTGSGSFVVNEAPGISQGMGVLTLTAGDGTIQSNYASGPGNAITFTSLAARAIGATANFVINGGTNGSTNKIVLSGQAANAFINQGLYFNGADFVWNDAGGFVRAINYGSDAGAVTSTTTGSQTATAHLQVSTNIVGQGTATFTTIKIVGANSLRVLAGNTVTVSGILKSGGGAASQAIDTGTAVTTPASGDLVVRTDALTDALTINLPVTNATATTFAKSGLGTLNMGTTAVCTYTGATNLNAGITTASVTTSLGAATTSTTANINIVNGATLQLAGNGTANAINFGTRSFNVAGTGASGRLGCIENITAISQINAISKLTLTDNATINCAATTGVTTAGEIDIRSSTPAINFNGFTMTKVGGAPFNIPLACTCTNSTGANGSIPGVSVAYTAGTLNSVEGTVSFSPNTGAVMVSSGATMYTYQPTMAAGVCPPVILNGGKFQHYPDGGSYTWPGTIVLAANTTSTIDNNSATASSTFTLSGQITGPGNLILTDTTATALNIFTGNNNYAGTTTVSTNQLQVGASGTTGSLSAGAVTLAAGTTLTFKRTDAGLIVPGAITGAGVVTFAGTGTTTLLGANSYTGATTVSAGTLIVDGTESVTSAIAFPAGTTLNGFGTLSSPVTVTAATIVPGDSVVPGTLTFSAAANPLTVNTTTVMNFRLNGAPGAGGTGNDYINAPNGPVTLSASNLLNLSGSPTVGGTYTLISGTSVTGTPTLNSNSTGLVAVLTNTGTAITVTFPSPGFTWTGLGMTSNWSDAGNWTPSAPVGTPMNSCLSRRVRPR